PSTSAPAIFLFPTDPAQYHVMLRISEPGCAQAQPLDLSIWALTALGPQPIGTNPSSGGSNDIRDLDAGDGYIWCATGNGAWRTAITAPHTPWQNVENVYTQGPGLVTGSLGAVFFDGSDAIVWYAAQAANIEVNQIALGANRIDVVDVAGSA